MSSQSVGGWQTVDTTEDPREFVRYLERVSEHPTLREISRARLSASGLQPGCTVLDLGCGIGSNTLMLAEFAGPTGLVRAVDRSRSMLEIARRRAEERGLRIICDEADAADLPFPDQSLDAVWTERVLMHVPSPLAVMRETRRVLNPQGRFIVMESEAASLTIADGDDPDLARRLERFWADGVAHPRIGQSLEALARRAGFTEIHVDENVAEFREFDFASDCFSWHRQLQSLVADGEIDGDRARRWSESVRDQAESDRVICSLSLFEMLARP